MLAPVPVAATLIVEAVLSVAAVEVFVSPLRLTARVFPAVEFVTVAVVAVAVAPEGVFATLLLIFSVVNLLLVTPRVPCTPVAVTVVRALVVPSSVIAVAPAPVTDTDVEPLVKILVAAVP